MLMKQKTVRFYEESKDDMAAYEKLQDYRNYGFSNARELMIAAINAYSQKENTFSGVNIDLERLADMIVDRMKKMDYMIEKIKPIQISAEDNSNIEVFEKALSFIEGL